MVERYDINKILLWILASLVVLYSHFPVIFSEMRLELGFLGTPVFIGEMMLGLCLVLFVVSRKFRRPGKIEWVFIFFYLFVVAKAVYGYVQWGPLALRNSALFYYSLFGLISCYALSDQKVTTAGLRKVLIGVGFAMFLLRLFSIRHCFSMDFFYTYFIILIVLILMLRNKLWIGFLLALTFGLGAFAIVLTSRTIIVSLAVSTVFLFITGIFVFTKVSKVKKWMLFFSCVGIFLVFITAVGDQNALKSLRMVKHNIITSQELGQAARNYDIDIRPEKGKVYEPSNEMQQKVDKAAQTEGFVTTEGEVQKQLNMRSLKTANVNMVWRLLVWQDMLLDWWESRAILGIDFGYPFRSKSVETLTILTGNQWSQGQWVGWIEPHNSYIHIIYRAGFVGIGFIISIIFLSFNMARIFVQHRSVVGILLFSIVVYWLVAANFAVILELPYFAIPFWIIFGMVLKFSSEIKGDLDNG